MTRGNRGATPKVLRAMGLTPDPERRAPEAGYCLQCQSEVEFMLGDYGQTLERCTNRRCANREWHPPIPPHFQRA